jgi:hypothetical protein
VANYNVDIAVAVKNTQAITDLSNKTDLLGQKIKNVNETLELFGNLNGKTVVNSVASFNEELAKAAKNFNDVQLGSSRAIESAREFAKAVDLENAALREQAALLAEVRNQGKSGTLRGGTQYKNPLGPFEASSIVPGAFKAGRGSSAAASEVTGLLERNLGIEKDRFLLRKKLREQEERSAQQLNEKVNFQNRFNGAMREGAAEAKALATQSAAAMGLNQPSGALGPVADLKTQQAAAIAAAKKVEDFVIKTAGKRQSLLDETNQKATQLAKQFDRTELDLTLKRAKVKGESNKQTFDDLIKLDQDYGREFDKRLKRRTQARKKAERDVADARKKADREAEKATSARKKGVQSALLGIGFPLLFGGGAGSITGGLLGSKGGFGGQILGSAIGAQIDSAIEKIKETAKAVSTVGGSFDFLTENSLYSNEETERLARKLEELGEVEKLAELNARELVNLIGNDGVRNLQDFNEASGELDSEMAELGLAFDSFMAYYLKPVVDFLNETVGAINISRRFKALQENLKDTPEGKKLDAEVKRLQEKNTRDAAEAAKGVPYGARTTTANGLETEQMASLLTQYEGLVPVTVDIPEGNGDGEPKLTGSKVDPTINLKKRLGVVNSLIEAEQRVNGLNSEGAGIVRRKLAFESRIAQIRETAKAERQRLTDLEDISLSKAIETNAEKLATLQFEREITVATERAAKASEGTLEPIQRTLDELKDRNAFEREYGELIMSGSTTAAAQQVIEAKKQVKEIEELVEKQLRSNEIQINILRIIVAQTDGTDAHATAQEALNKALEREKEIREKGEKAKGEVKGEKTPAERIKEEIKQIQGALNDLIDPANQIISAANAIGNAFSESFKGLIAGSMSAQEALRNLFQRTADHFLDMAAQMIAKQIQMKILGIGLNILGGMGGGMGGIKAGTGSSLGGGNFAKIGAGNLFAEGGYVTGPTNAVVGEGGEPEYVIPSSKMTEAMGRYARGARGGAVIPDGSGGDAGGEMGGRGGSIDVTYNVERINSVDYVTAAEFERGMTQAAKRGAEMGKRGVYSDLVNKRSVRSRVGI